MVWLGRHGARTIGTDARFEGLCRCRPCAHVVKARCPGMPAPCGPLHLEQQCKTDALGKISPPKPMATCVAQRCR